MRFVVEVAADDLRFEVGREPTYHVVASPEDAAPGAVHRSPFELGPGERVDLMPPVLLARVPGATALDLGLTLVTDAGRDTGLGPELVTVRPGGPSRLVVTRGDVTLVIEARAGIEPLDPAARLGLTLDGSLAPSELATRVGGALVLKHYAGLRRWLLRPGCDSDLACAVGGASYPCVSTCACRCEDTCDCDFAGLEVDMQTQALAAAHRIVGADAPLAELGRVRLHWVFKRSLGGTSNCDGAGELDVTPRTYGAFFAAATRAASAINLRAGFRLIDVLSPMNEANHPLQDGAHHNAAGQPTVAGLLTFVDLIAQASCAGDRCCAPDRYIVPSPDVVAILAEALGKSEEVLAALPDRALAPEVALSLYLDVEQVDPFQRDGAGALPSIVSPLPVFFAELAQALASRAFPDGLLVVDTYPGSWGAPWFETPDRIVHHMDPTTERLVRVEPVAAADAAVTRALKAADDFRERFAASPSVLLGEVGWSTFDGDEAAQAAFARRLFDAVAGRRADDQRLEGLIWFKSQDGAAFSYPSWTEAPNPLGGEPIACATHGLGPIVCAADVLATMEGQWGLLRLDGSKKPAWEAFVARWARR